MKIKKLTVQTDSGNKNLVLVGEMHIYNEHESAIARNLIQRHNFEYAFFEGVDFGTKDAFIYETFKKMMKFVLIRKEKGLDDLVIENKIPIHRLEKGMLPLKSRIGLTILLGLVLFIPILFIFSILTRKWKLALEIGASVIGGLLFFKYLAKKAYFSRLGKYLPVDKEKRDVIMATSLSEYLQNRQFKTGLVVVGEAHFDEIISRIKENFVTAEQ